MRILFVGPPLDGLLYSVLSLTQAFRVNGYEVLGGNSHRKQQRQGWWCLTPHPVLIPKPTIAAARHSERKVKSVIKWATSRSLVKRCPATRWSSPDIGGPILIVFGEAADRPVIARDGNGLPARMINASLKILRFVPPLKRWRLKWRSRPARQRW